MLSKKISSRLFDMFVGKAADLDTVYSKGG